MAQQSVRRDQENQGFPPCLEHALGDLDRIRELPYRPATASRRTTGRTDGSIRLRVRNSRIHSCAEGGVHRWIADVQKVWIKPNILMSRSSDEAPTGRQAKEWDRFRTPLLQMRDVDRHEEVVIGRGRFSSPDVPAGCVARRRMAKAVDGQQAVENVFRDADLHVRRRRHEFGTVLAADAHLIRRWVHTRTLSPERSNVCNGSGADAGSSPDSGPMPRQWLRR